MAILRVVHTKHCGQLADDPGHQGKAPKLDLKSCLYMEWHIHMCIHYSINSSTVNGKNFAMTFTMVLTFFFLMWRWQQKEGSFGKP